MLGNQHQICVLAAIPDTK